MASASGDAVHSYEDPSHDPAWNGASGVTLNVNNVLMPCNWPGWSHRMRPFHAHKILHNYSTTLCQREKVSEMRTKRKIRQSTVVEGKLSSSAVIPAQVAATGSASRNSHSNLFAFNCGLLLTISSSNCQSVGPSLTLYFPQHGERAVARSDPWSFAPCVQYLLGRKRRRPASVLPF